MPAVSHTPTSRILVRPRWFALLAAALLVTACGTAHGTAHTTASPVAAKSRAAEPGKGPPLTAKPAGVSVPVGMLPQGIVVDRAGVVAVGVSNPDSIELLRAATGAVLTRVPIAGAPRHLALAGPDGPLLVPEEHLDRLLELSLPGGHSRSFVVGEFPHAAAAGFGRVYVGNERGGSLSVILPSGSVQRVGGFTQPGGIAVSGDDIAVVDVGAFTLTLLDARTLQMKGRITAGAGPTHDVAGPGGRVYVADTRGDALLTFSTHPLRLLGRTPVPGSPYGIAIDPQRNRVWLTESADNRLAELDIAGTGLPTVIHTYPTGRQPDTVAVDASTGRVYVANQLSDTVEMITPKR